MMRQVKEYHLRGKAQYTVDVLVKVDGFIKRLIIFSTLKGTDLYCTRRSTVVSLSLQ